jgi:cytidylate kinase
MNIVVAGLTGSGKTTATRLAADMLGFDWISGSDLRRELLFGEPAGGSDDRLTLATSDASIDAEHARLRAVAGEAEFDAELLRLARSRRDTIFDTWFLPWLMPPNLAPRVLLRAALGVRISRVARQRPGAARAEVAGLIGAKDERARQYAARQYGIDITADTSPFDAVVTTDSLPAGLVAKFLGLVADRNRVRALGESELERLRSAVEQRQSWLL